MTARTTVVNIHRGDAFDVYIGRAGRGHGGYFGNPFKRGTREVNLENYRRWFEVEVAENAKFRHAVLQLRGKRLGCFCAPLPCHGDVIARWVDAQSI